MNNIHIISHTHWDREWYQTFQQFRLRLVHLTDRLLALLESDPDYRHFTLDGQTIVLEDYLQMRPHQADTLKHHIQNGRLLIGPWYILPDEFLVSPEATIRNLMIGKEICAQFGGRMMIGYIPDPFGHISQMPQILQGFGIHTACFWRGLSDEPVELYWQAPDGSRVFTLYLRESYGNGAGLPTGEPERFSRELLHAAELLLSHSATSAGEGQAVIMLGTDHMEPPLDTSSAIAAAAQNLTGTRVLHSTLPAAIQAVQEQISRLGCDIPTIQGELRSPKRMPLLPGVLSTRMWIKQRNRACETLLERWAEPFSAWASVLSPSSSLTSPNLADPAPLLQQAWKLLIQCHPHDSICGCSIDQVHEEMRPRFDQVDQIGEEITRQSLEIIAGCVNTLPPPGVQALKALVVFNACDCVQSGPVTTVLDLPSAISQIQVVDQAGTVIPHQYIGQDKRELFAATLDSQGLAESANMIHEGRVAGMVVREMVIRQDGELVYVDLILAENGEPDLPAWEAGSSALLGLTKDGKAHTFIVRARTAHALQLQFTAPEVPALGYRTFWVCPAPAVAPRSLSLNPMLRLVMPLAARLAAQPAVHRLISRLSNAGARLPVVIENETLSLSASASDGTLTLTDKLSGQVYTGLNRFVDGGDCGDEYNYAPPPQDSFQTAKLHHAEAEKGPAGQTLILHLRLFVPLELDASRKSRSNPSVTIPITCRATLHQGVHRVDIVTEIHNCARDHRLRVHFPALFTVEHFFTDGHFDVLSRPAAVPTGGADWIEEPRPEAPQRWFSTLSNDSTGLTLANRGLPEIEALQAGRHTELVLTLLRCVGWLSRDDFSTRKGHAGPCLATPGAQESGRHCFHYALIPHSGSWQSALPQVRGFECPMRAASLAPQAGSLPGEQSWFTLQGSFQVTCVKTATCGRGIILRGWAPAAGRVKLQCSLPLVSVQYCQLDETPLKVVPFSQPGCIELDVRSHEILTLLLEPAG